MIKPYKTGFNTVLNMHFLHKIVPQKHIHRHTSFYNFLLSTNKLSLRKTYDRTELCNNMCCFYTVCLKIKLLDWQATASNSRHQSYLQWNEQHCHYVSLYSTN